MTTSWLLRVDVVFACDGIFGTVVSLSALEWNGHYDLVTGHINHIKQYDLHSPHPEAAFYPVFNYSTDVSQLKWNDNILAAAGGCCICLWDIWYGCGPAPLFMSSNSEGSCAWSFVQRKELSPQLVEPMVFGSGTSNQAVFERPFLPWGILSLISPGHRTATNSWPRMARMPWQSGHLLIKPSN
jgi:hypothetical protein